MEIYVGRKVNMNQHFIRVNQNNLEIDQNFPCSNTITNFQKLQKDDILIFINNDEVYNLKELSSKSYPSDIEIYEITSSPNTKNNPWAVGIKKIYSKTQKYKTLQNIIFNELQNIPHIFFDPNKKTYYERIFNISMYNTNSSAQKIQDLIEIFDQIPDEEFETNPAQLAEIIYALKKETEKYGD